MLEHLVRFPLDFKPIPIHHGVLFMPGSPASATTSSGLASTNAVFYGNPKPKPKPRKKKVDKKKK